MSCKFLYAKENDIPTSLVLYYYNYRARSDSHYSRFATFEGFARPLFFKLKKEGFAISNDSQL